MIRNIEDSPLYRMANPRSMAFFGASNNPISMGTNLFLSNLGIGFDGPVYPVHPKEDRVHGLKAFRTALDLPEAPDLAVLVVPTASVVQVLEECGQRGIRQAIIVSGGFKEVGGDGPELEKQITAIARKYGIRFLGPNCLGVANTHHKVNTTFIPHEGGTGFIGLASQSGSLITQMFSYLSQFGLNYSTAFSVGNEADIDLCDCMAYLGSDPKTKTIGLYIEGIKRGREFVNIARQITPHKPIVAYYVGGSESGKRAGFSHTGSMAGPDRLYDGIFRQAGIVRADNLTELYDFCWILGSQPLPDGNRAVIQTHSGGPGAAAADACSRSGLKVPALSKITTEKLTDYVPHTGSISNPVDITFSRDQSHFYREIPTALMEDENTDMLLMYFLTPVSVMERTLMTLGLSEKEIESQCNQLVQQNCDHISQVAAAHGKPLAGFTVRSFQEISIRELVKRGIVVFPSAERAARALGALVTYAGLRGKISR